MMPLFDTCFSNATAPLRTLAALSCLALPTGARAEPPSEGLPTYALTISCELNMLDDLSGVDVEKDEGAYHRLRDALWAFFNFAAAHKGNAVYLEVSILAQGGADRCDMSDEQLADRAVAQSVPYGQINPSYGLYYVTHSTPEFYSINANARYGEGVSLVVSLPAWREEMSRGLFLDRKEGSFLFFSGPVVIRTEASNGAERAWITPIDNSVALWREVAAARASLKE